MMVLGLGIKVKVMGRDSLVIKVALDLEKRLLKNQLA